MTLQLRPVRYDDADALRLVAAMGAELSLRYGDEGLSPAAAHEFDPPGVFLLGELDGRPVACGGLRFQPTGAAELKRMYVDPDVRGRGLSRTLLRELVARARASGAPRLLLETGTEQPEAVGLYESEGWSPVAPFGHYAHDPRTRCYELLL